MDTIPLAKSKAPSLNNMFLHHLKKDVSTAGDKWDMSSSAPFLPLEPREAAGVTSDTLPTTEGVSEPVERAKERWDLHSDTKTTFKERFRGGSAKRKIKLLIFAEP